MEGAQGFSAPPVLKVMKTFLRLDEFYYAFAKRIKERYTSINRIRMLQPCTRFLFPVLLSNTQVWQASFCHACKMAWLKGWSTYVLQHSPPITVLGRQHWKNVRILHFNAAKRKVSKRRKIIIHGSWIELVTKCKNVAQK